ncbi:hypothetical protein SI65_01941 [Aspergillus cristatus]|uniref:Uncharacterized protein n=1 Tax=Aspergillus cristatus TaxID=573508 RepID=A0A1E3BU99_ASPCR|nr:hypothetical protein SI65_01941 [Aspergillus cristatus]
MLRWAAAPVPAAVAHEGPTCQQSQRDSLPGREEERTPKGCERARGRHSPIWGAPDPRLHIYSPTLAGRPIGAQAFDGPESDARGPTLYGVVRALVDFAIQSGPPRFAPYPGRKGPSVREARGFVLAGAPVGRVKGLGAPSPGPRGPRYGLPPGPRGPR